MFIEQRHIGWIVVAVLSLLPIWLWLNAPSIGGRPVDFMTGLGQVLGLASVILFSLNFILSVRLRFINKLFGDLNGVYQKHSQIGQLALMLLLLHPLFLIPKYAGNISEAASFLWFGRGRAMDFGIIALFMTVVLVALTLYLRPRYDIWKWTHKLIGIAFYVCRIACLDGAERHGALSAPAALRVRAVRIGFARVFV